MAKKSLQKMMDPDSTAALSIVEMEQNKELFKTTEQQAREHAIAQCHEVIGRIQGLNMISKFADVSNLMWFKDIKEQKIYRDLPGIGTWDKFCDYIGISRQKVDEDLVNLLVFGEDFLTTVGSLRVGYRELRKLRQLTHNGDVIIEAEYATIGEERIPLDKDHAEDLQAAIESLIETKNKQVQEQQAALRAKDKVLKDKETVINRQAKELSKLEGRAESMGYSPGEEALIKKMDAARITVDGFFMQFDPEKNPLPEDATPRMRAKLMHTLDYFKRVVLAAYDTAADIYGVPEIDDDWVPPHLRTNSATEA